MPTKTKKTSKAAKDEPELVWCQACGNPVKVINRTIEQHSYSKDDIKSCVLSGGKVCV